MCILSDQIEPLIIQDFFPPFKQFKAITERYHIDADRSGSLKYHMNSSSVYGYVQAGKTTKEERETMENAAMGTAQS